LFFFIGRDAATGTVCRYPGYCREDLRRTWNNLGPADTNVTWL